MGTKGKKKGGKAGSDRLGAALIKGQRRAKVATREARRKQDDNVIAALGFESAGTTTKSVTETGGLEAFLADAVLAGRKFHAERNSRVIELDVDPENAAATGSNLMISGENEDAPVFDYHNLPVPRRPAWTHEMTAEELDQKEKAAFLAWRRGIAAVEAKNPHLHVTPFEKNLDFWRQLWRVVERSDVVVQVVDARNPLLFRCPDVEAFMRETGDFKHSFLLVNKADFLTPELRAEWREFFIANNIDFCFFSAKREQDILNGKDAEAAAAEDQEPICTTRCSADLVSRKSLVAMLEEVALATRSKAGDARRPEDKATVGMIGYPNVGKSSVINVVFGVTSTDHNTARVSVAATPGHTKHFQTLHLSNNTTLCDCPGLVFPTFMNTKADLICNGVLPIDEIRGRDFYPAIQVITRCIDRETFERTYALKLPLADVVTHVPADMLIECFCEKRGYFGSGHGRFNEAHGSRMLLKDFVAGKLCYSCPPPADGIASQGNLLTVDATVDQGDGSTQAAEQAAPFVPLSTLELGSDDEDFGPGAALPEDAEITEEDLALLMNDEQTLFSETNKIAATIAKANRKPSKKKKDGKGRRGRHDDPYGSGDYFEVRAGGKDAKGKAFTRVEQPYQRNGAM